VIIASLQIGQIGTHEYQGKAVETAIFKQPVEGPIQLGRLGFTGDQVADTLHHGGAEKAVLVYAQAHYPHWSAFLGRELGPAALGENLTISGATEAEVCIGDTYQLGGAVIQVCQPRVPCFKTNLRLGHTGVLPEIIRTGYTGFYLRVLQEGAVAKGDRFTLLRRPEGAPTVAFANQIRMHERENQAGLRRLLEAEGLAADWVEWLQARLEA
jgi:MOSC domain-containing protein YiiM